MTTPSYDLAVVGSGGAALVAACVAADRGLKTIVLESTDLIGGTTALSGGQMWIPDSAAMSRAGLSDSPEEALEYLRRVCLGMSTDESLRAFLRDAPRFIDYLENDLGIPVVSVDRHDYHPDWAGAARGRTVEPLPVSTEGLGAWRERTRTSPTRRPVTGPESRRGIEEDVLLERESLDVRTQGSGLAAGLVKAALSRGVELRVRARVSAVTRSEITFVVTAGADKLTASNVLLASGGFARNAGLRRNFLPAVDIVPTAAPGACGDGLELGISLGGRLKGMAEAWWTPAVSIDGELIDGLPLHRNVVRELAFPGSILVNAAGHRFVNEASSYNDLAKAFHAFDPSTHTFPNQPAWLIFDAEFKNQRSVAGSGPGTPVPNNFVQAPDLESLAQQCRIDPAGLRRTIGAFNQAAASGVDEQFGRGGNPHDRFNGDETHLPNPCLGAMGDGPVFAVPIVLGANGTKGGLITDELSRVLNSGGEPIDGLFAVGECAAALMGPGYAGSGASLGPALTAAFTLAQSFTPPISSRPGGHIISAIGSNFSS